MSDNYLHSDLTGQIIGCFYKVYNQLGYGFLEKVYENALVIELRAAGLFCQPQKPIDVYYNDTKVGYYIADLVVEHSVIVEIKAAESLCKDHEAQLVNYLKATNIEVGILLNFGKKAEFKRKVFNKEYKHLNPSSLS